MVTTHDWHRPYEDNPYIDEVCASLPPKYQWTCSRCGQVVYEDCSKGMPDITGCNGVRCCDCKNGEYRGYPAKNSPEWEVGTVYFWCPIKEHHNQYNPICENFNQGSPKKFDKFGNEM